MRVLLFLVFLVALTADAQQRTKEIDNAIQTLAEITGLEPLKKVDHSTITREGVRKFLEERIREEIKPEEIRLEEIVLKRFGLVPEEFDLRATTVNLITEQAAAFYDYRRKKLFVLEGDNPGGMSAETVLIHELAHALADQHFNLGKYIRAGRSDDGSTARMAVMEGQATWLMMEAMARRMGHSILDMPEMTGMITSGVSAAMAEQYPELAKAPLYLRASLIFPYSRGLQFQHALLKKLGNEAFRRVFREPPVSTQQVLHPELYLQRTLPEDSPVPSWASRREWKEAIKGTVGEFDHAVLLEQFVSSAEAERLAPKWRGGAFELLEDKKAAGRFALMYSSVWSDEQAAAGMFQAWRSILKTKSREFRIERESATELTGTTEHGRYRVVLDGKRVLAAEGLATLGEPARQVN